MITGSEDLRGSQAEDGAGVLLQRGADGRHAACLSGGNGTRREATQLIERIDVGDGNLSEETRFVHHGNGLARIVTLGRLTRQHDAVSTIEHSVAHVRHFGTRRARIVCHALEHLRGANYRLAGDVALGDHHLLCYEHLRGRDLNAEITARDHDPIGDLEDGVEVVHALLILDFGNDLDVMALRAKDVANVQDVLLTPDEGGENHIDAVLDAKLQVSLVLLRQRGKVDVRAGQVHALLAADLAIVDGTAAQRLRVSDR